MDLETLAFFDGYHEWTKEYVDRMRCFSDTPFTLDYLFLPFSFQLPVVKQSYQGKPNQMDGTLRHPISTVN